jgi:hypothetical protein
MFISSSMDRDVALFLLKRSMARRGWLFGRCWISKHRAMHRDRFISRYAVKVERDERFGCSLLVTKKEHQENQQAANVMLL